LVITFDEAVDAVTGNITLYKSDDSTVEAIDVTSGQVTGTETTTITIDPTADLAEQTSYYVQIAAAAFDDASSNTYAGITDKTTWNFTSLMKRIPLFHLSLRLTVPRELLRLLIWLSRLMRRWKVKW
jgi:hypothetical protein